MPSFPTMNLGLARFGLIKSNDALYPVELIIPATKLVDAAGANGLSVAVPKVRK